MFGVCVVEKLRTLMENYFAVVNLDNHRNIVNVSVYSKTIKMFKDLPPRTAREFKLFVSPAPTCFFRKTKFSFLKNIIYKI